MRIAATRALCGAFGTEARKAIAQRLDDDNHADVRAAAVDALRACCAHDPAPFACALFHQRVDVRRLALENAPVRLPVAQQVLLLRDDETKGDVEKVLDRRAQDGAIAPALLAARKLKLMDDAEVTRRLLALPWADKTGDVLNAMPFAAVVEQRGRTNALSVIVTPEVDRAVVTKEIVAGSSRFVRASKRSRRRTAGAPPPPASCTRCEGYAASKSKARCGGRRMDAPVDARRRHQEDRHDADASSTRLRLRHAGATFGALAARALAVRVRAR